MKKESELTDGELFRYVIHGGVGFIIISYSYLYYTPAITFPIWFYGVLALVCLVTSVMAFPLQQMVDDEEPEDVWLIGQFLTE